MDETEAAGSGQRAAQRSEAPILLAAGVAALLLALQTAHALISLAPAERVRFVPDDAYYYLTLARNFARHGEWSTDGGVSLTSGFHPLHAYALVGLQRATGASDEAFVSAAMQLGVLLFAIVGTAAIVWSARTRNWLGIAAFCLFALSRNALGNAVSGMEWPWVVFCAAALCAWFGGADPSRLGARLTLLAIAAIGSWARTDFGLLPAALLAAALVGAGPKRRSELGGFAAFGLLGALAGLAGTFLHNRLTTGQLLQSSVLTKDHWRLVDGPAPHAIFEAVGGLFGVGSAWGVAAVAVVIVASLVAGTIGLAQRAGEDTTSHTRRNVLWLACVLTCAGYLLVYSRVPFAALQDWYTANLIVPLFLVIALPGRRDARRPQGRLAVAAQIVLVGVLLGLNLGIPRSDAWLTRVRGHPLQTTMYHAGRWLRTAELPGRVGGWNSGVVGYYAGGAVTNLDGLVNNDVVPFIRSGRLPRYVDEVGIRFIVDWEIMLAPEYRKRGGYDDPEFVARLASQRRSCLEAGPCLHVWELQPPQHRDE